MKRGQTNKRLSFTIILILVLAILVSLYLRNRDTSFVGESKKSTVELLLEKDIENQYPATPREVLKLYVKYVKSFYNDKLDDVQVNKMADRVRLLFDEELVAHNPLDDYLLELKSEIAIFKDSSRTMVNHEVQNNQNIAYWEKDGMEYSSVLVSFTVKEGADRTKVYQKFTLRKDENENWKILSWNVVTDEKEMKKM